MTANNSIDPARFLSEHLERAEPELLRSMLGTFIDALMGAEADALCGAPYGVRSQERVNSRNGYRSRDWDTRAGTMEVAIPKLRAGSYFPDWLLERRRRAERALTTVVATCYLLGVSTRRMEKLVETLGITALSKSQVSVMARELDEHVADFRSGPLDAGPYTFVAADALVLKVREGGRVVNVHALVAAGVNADGHREILGVQVTSAEDGAGWLSFFRDLTARGLSGVALVTSDAHQGLVAAYNVDDKIARLDRAGLLYAVVADFADLDVRPSIASNEAMGYIFETLLRKVSAGVRRRPKPGHRLPVLAVSQRPIRRVVRPGRRRRGG